MNIKNTILTFASIALMTGCEQKTILNVYTWSDYIDPEVIQAFESEYGCRVDITTFDSNEAMYAKLKAGATGYDIITPSSYIIPFMVKDGMLQKLDKMRIPDVIKNFDESFSSQIIDKEMTYSVPYLATYGGIMYQKEKVTLTNEISWNIMENPSYRGRFSLLDDFREVIGAGLMYNGFSINSENKAEIDIAVKTVLKWRENARKFDAESYKTEVANGSSYFGHGYNSDAYQVIIGEGESPRDDIGFALPKEGFSIAFDEFVIMKDARQKKLAYEFINFMYRPENSLKNMVYGTCPTPNKVAIGMLGENLKKLIIPEDSIMKRGQVLKQLKGEDTLSYYCSAWDKIRSIKK